MLLVYVLNGLSSRLFEMRVQEAKHCFVDTLICCTCHNQRSTIPRPLSPEKLNVFLLFFLIFFCLFIECCSVDIAHRVRERPHVIQKQRPLEHQEEREVVVRGQNSREHYNVLSPEDVISLTYQLDLRQDTQFLSVSSDESEIE